MKTYNNCVIVIKAKRKTKAEMLTLMDLYVMNDRITAEQYAELIALMEEVGLE